MFSRAFPSYISSDIDSINIWRAAVRVRREVGRRPILYGERKKPGMTASRAGRIRRRDADSTVLALRGFQIHIANPLLTPDLTADSHLAAAASESGGTASPDPWDNATVLAVAVGRLQGAPSPPTCSRSAFVWKRQGDSKDTRAAFPTKTARPRSITRTTQQAPLHAAPTLNGPPGGTSPSAVSPRHRRIGPNAVSDVSRHQSARPNAIRDAFRWLSNTQN